MAIGPQCDEIGRATRAYVSAYDRTRVHQVRLYRFEKRCLVANFNGAFPLARKIVSATWRTDGPAIGVLSSVQISDDFRETSVLFASQLSGFTNVRAEVALDNGEVYNQVYLVNVRMASWYFDDPIPQVGVFNLTQAIAPPTPVVLAGQNQSPDLFLTWTAATSQRSTISSYHLLRSVDGGAYVEITEVPASAPREYLDTDVIRTEHRYDYKVAAEDALGLESPDSNIVSFPKLDAVIVVLARNSFAQALLSRQNGSWEMVPVPASNVTAGVFVPAFDANGGFFCAVGPQTSMTSHDGVNWVKTTGLPNIQTSNRAGVAYSKPLGLFAYVADSGILTSPNGVNWTPRTNPGNMPACVIWSDAHQLFIAGTVAAVSGASIMTSPDGITWTLRTTPLTGCFAIAANGGRIVCMQGNENNSYTSDDGITYGNVQVVPLGAFHSLVFGAGLFVAVDPGGNGRGVVSSDSGNSWTEASEPSGVPIGNWQRMCFSTERARFYACGSSSLGNLGQLVISTASGLAWGYESTPSAADTGEWFPIMAGFAPPPQVGPFSVTVTV